MEFKGESVTEDLYLSFSRLRSSQWERRKSPGRYRQALICYEAEFGNLYIQGSCTNEDGKELSAQEVAKLVGSYGRQAINYLAGSFAIAVDDRRTGIWCAVDFSASFPLYYKLNKEEFSVTTRAENLNVSDTRELDVAGVLTFLNAGFPWGDLTLLKDWKVLRPGQIIYLDRNDQLTIETYFDPENDGDAVGFKYPEELLKDVDKGLISIASRFKRILVPLSGGVDSRLIAVRCHQLGIPFEAITFVANVLDGDDFDIASRIANVLGVKHHRWDWNPTTDCIENFKKLCLATGGTNDAFTSYPDAMAFFGSVASEFDCVLRGDHTFGMGEAITSPYQSAYRLSMNYKDNLNWALNPAYQDMIDLETILREQEDFDAGLIGAEIDSWRHRSYRRSRSPRFTQPMGQLQAEHAIVINPLQTKNIVSRISRTENIHRNNKQMVREALSIGSSSDINRIPISKKPTWMGGEPLLNLPPAVIEEMLTIVRCPNLLSELVNDTAIADRFLAHANKVASRKRDLVASLKFLVKKILPKSLLGVYEENVKYPHVPGYLVFKRFFAAKVFLDCIAK